VQEVYHLACPTSIKNFERLRLETLLTNSSGMRNTLDVAVRYHAKYLFTSSSVVYGPRVPGREMFDEADEGIVNHLSPRACYDEGKRFAETMVETYRQVYGLDTKIARIFRTYGPRLRINDAQPPLDFIIDALEGKDLHIYGEGLSSSFCYVSDVVDGVVRLMHHPEQIGPVNFGDDRDHMLDEIALSIVKIVNSSSRIVHEPPLPFLSSLGLPSLKKAKDVLGWFPLVRLEDGLRKTIDYAVANKEALGLSL
jgi:UDP-glucuronate decarboxylase